MEEMTPILKALHALDDQKIAQIKKSADSTFGSMDFKKLLFMYQEASDRESSLAALTGGGQGGSSGGVGQTMIGGMLSLMQLETQKKMNNALSQPPISFDILHKSKSVGVKEQYFSVSLTQDQDTRSGLKVYAQKSGVVTIQCVGADDATSTPLVFNQTVETPGWVTLNLQNYAVPEGNYKISAHINNEIIPVIRAGSVALIYPNAGYFTLNESIDRRYVKEEIEFIET